MMENGFYADTLQLLQHSIEIQQQKRTAQLLYEQLSMARKIAAPVDVPYYDKLLAQTDGLVRYFTAMSETVENMSMELEQLSLKIGAMLEENAYWNK